MTKNGEKRQLAGNGGQSNRKETFYDTFDGIEIISDEESNQNCLRFEYRKKHLVVAMVAAVLIIALLSVGVGIGYKSSKQNEEVPPDIGIEGSLLGKYSGAAVATDGADCAPIGMEVLRRNGTAVDAAIATLFCNGLFSCHSMGIGGGFVMTIYNKETGTVDTLDARETAPAAATVNMFHGNPSASTKGALSVAVPGEIRGYFTAKSKYGNPNVTWASLIEPSIKMAETGIRVSWSLAEALVKEKNNIFKDPGLRQIFINPVTNDTWKEGDVYKRVNVAQTLRRVATSGPDEFYTGETAKNLVKDLADLGGIITLEDMKNYQAVWQNPVSVNLGNEILYSIGPPASGAILVYILNILKHFNIGPKDENPLMYHRVAEAFKWAYAQRSKLGDPFDPEITTFVNELVANLTSEELARSTYAKINDTFTVNNSSYYGGQFWSPTDAGTSHTSVLAPNGDAVSVTSTINLHLGSGIMSPSTGVIFNDEMDDFSSPNITNDFNLPPSPNNFIKPGKRPLSSMSPAIIVDKDSGKVRLITGAAGGSKITTSTALVILRNLWLGQDIKKSIDQPRIHHQLIPMRVDYEKGLDQAIVDGLISRGHSVNEVSSASVVTGIALEKDGYVYANADVRKAGATAGF